MTVVEEATNSVNTSTSHSYLKQREEYFLSNKMLATHQRLPLHLEYLQPQTTNTESKTSPLALLAATCSSIGKTDIEHKDVRATPSSLNKLKNRVEEHKSSFKPYKIDLKHQATPRSSPPTLTPSVQQKQEAVASSMFQNRLQTTMSVSESERLRVLPQPLHRASKEFLSSALKCHSSPPLPHAPSKSPLLTPHGLDRHGECSHCNIMRPHMEYLPPKPSQLPITPPCSCPSCSHSRSDRKCHYPMLPVPQTNIHAMYPSYRTQQQPIVCRDPGCTNCSKIPMPTSHGNVQNFLHPALIHQCTHGPAHKSQYHPPPPPAHLSSYEGYAKLLSNNGKPYVCNWVSEGKHCGLGFVTSEDLFQHLKTHTSLQQQQQKNYEPNMSQNPVSTHEANSTTNTCNIYGCPCGQRKTSPQPSATYSYPTTTSQLRYSPYSKTGHSYTPPPLPIHRPTFNY